MQVIVAEALTNAIPAPISLHVDLSAPFQNALLKGERGILKPKCSAFIPAKRAKLPSQGRHKMGAPR